MNRSALSEKLSRRGAANGAVRHLGVVLLLALV